MPGRLTRSSVHLRGPKIGISATKLKPPPTKKAKISPIPNIEKSATKKKEPIPNIEKSATKKKDVVYEKKENIVEVKKQVIDKNEIPEDHADIDEQTLKMLLACFNPTEAPKELPCRDDELRQILDFVKSNLDAGTSGCTYISGLPGTGKTASVRLVMQKLISQRSSLPAFEFVELNGLLVTDPKRIFVDFYKALYSCKQRFFDGKKNKKDLRVSPAAAVRKLDGLFALADDDRPAIVLLFDEIDAIVKKHQRHLYRILDWVTQQGSKLTVITVGNTFDLVDTLLTNRNHSRMGLSRLPFKPYNHKEINEILISRLQLKPDAVESDAIERIARTVASVSGDVRRAFEFCRLTIELALSDLDASEAMEPTTTPGKRKSKRLRRCGRITMDHVARVLKQLTMNVQVQAIMHGSTHEKAFMEAAVQESRRTGLEEIAFNKIWYHYRSICHSNDIDELCVDGLLDVADRLAACRLLIKVTSSNDGYETFTARYRLNVNAGDVDIALAKGV